MKGRGVVMKERLEAFLNEYKNTVRRYAHELRSKPMPEITEELFSLFEKTGNRIKYEAVYFLRRKYIAVFGLVALMDKREEDIRRLEEVIENICNEECWALPAHVNRSRDKDWQTTVDLFACETAQTLAEIITLLDKELSTKIKDLARNEVFRRVLNPFYNSKVGHYWWEVCDNNWCAVCSGAIGSASIYLLADKPEQLNLYLQRICNSLNHYIAGFPEDGTCMEGLGYFTYGMTYYTGFAQQLYDYTKGKMDLMAAAKTMKIATFQQKCYFKSGRTLSFSDGDSKDRFRVGLTCYLATRYPEVAIPNMNQSAGFDFDPCYRWMSIYRDYIWTSKYIDKLNQGKIKDGGNFEPQGQVILSDAQWTICHSTRGAGMAAKGGCNGEPHNHNDIGSFFYIHDGDMLLTDLGAGEYTKEYFGQGRYQILCNSSLGHNLPLINGKTQLAGKEYQCDRFEADGKGKTIISFAGAYEEGIIDKIERVLHFNEDNGVLIVEDNFSASDKTRRITENLVTQWKPEIIGNQILIRGKERGCKIILFDKNSSISCIHQIHKDHGGEETDVYLLQWDLLIQDKEAYARMEIIPID